MKPEERYVAVWGYVEGVYEIAGKGIVGKKKTNRNLENYDFPDFLSSVLTEDDMRESLEQRDIYLDNGEVISEIYVLLIPEEHWDKPTIEIPPSSYCGGILTRNE